MRQCYIDKTWGYKVRVSVVLFGNRPKLQIVVPLQDEMYSTIKRNLLKIYKSVEKFYYYCL